MFLLGIGGKGIRRFSAAWTHPKLYKLMYSFVFRLYDPGDLMDRSNVDMAPLVDRVTYTIRIPLGAGVDGVETELECVAFSPIYTTNPFGTRTHILSNPHSDIMINDRVLTVFKDQLCRPDPRFDKYTILVHGQERLPGMVEAVYHKLIDMPERFDVARKHRIGLRQSGNPITSVPTLKGMLEIVFDVLEGNLMSANKVVALTHCSVLRYMSSNREVIHRDISKGNVLYLEDPIHPPADAGYSWQDTEPKEVPLCFIKYLLRERYVQIDCWDWSY